MAPRARSLLQFLTEARHAHLQFLSKRSPSPIYVLGNPSADLDSIISAIVYSYFAHNRSHLTPPRLHVPLINLANVSAGPELKRLRPEFGKALWLCTGRSNEREWWEDTPESAGEVLRECIVTVQDFASQLRQLGKGQRSADVILVDWNALPVRGGQRGQGSLDTLPSVLFNVLGCIDHHVDEDFLPSPDAIPQNQPLLVKKAGSCTSLVVKSLRQQGLWSEADGEGEPQVAQLALASILIDTAKLAAKDKVTDWDTDAFEFLSPKVNSNAHTEQSDVPSYYSQIYTAKQTSLNLLTVPEILTRDYKSWEEPRQSGSGTVKLGFCSAVRPLPWIIHKAGTAQQFLGYLHSLAKDEGLDIVVVMTAFTSTSRDGGDKNEQFCRELLICAVDETVGSCLDSFVTKASSQLGLIDWKPLGQDTDGNGVVQEVKTTFNQDKPWRRVWVQTDLAKSRKQVAPLLREAARL